MANKKMGRPPIEIDQEDFEKLCAMFCTEEEIADFFDCSIDTINRWCKRTYNSTYAEIYKKKSVGARVSLRRMQFNLAKKNAPMAIFLGKQYLGQRDSFANDGDELDKVDIMIKELDKESKRK